jgi:hypothetical protein
VRTRSSSASGGNTLQEEIKRFQKGGFFFGFYHFFMYDIQHCFICRPSDSTVSEDAGIGPRTVATTALTVRRSNHSATRFFTIKQNKLKGTVSRILAFDDMYG